MTHQVANLRVQAPKCFGDDATLRAWQRECRDALAVQRVVYAVAPRMSVTLADGRILKPGQEVTAALLQGGLAQPRGKVTGGHDQERAPLPGHIELARLVRAGRVLEADLGDDGPRAA